MNNIAFGVVAFLTFGISFISAFIFLSNYYKYRKKDMLNGLSGCEIAEKILKANHLENVYVIQINGELCDNYDANRNVIKLSKTAFHHSDIASALLASYMASLAIKNKKKTTLISLNNVLKPILDILIIISYIALLISLILNNYQYLKITIGVMFIIVIYHLLTNKLARDTKVRASLELKKLSLVSKEEIEDVNQMSEALSYLPLASLILIPIELCNKLIKK